MGIRLLSFMGRALRFRHSSRKGCCVALRERRSHHDAAALECAKEASGEIRLDIEAAFSQGLPSTPMAHSQVRVVSGNFVTARPLVRDRRNRLPTHRRRSEGRRRCLAFHPIQWRDRFVILLGFFADWRSFQSDDVEDTACAVATALKADSLILLDGNRRRARRRWRTAQRAHGAVGRNPAWKWRSQPDAPSTWLCDQSAEGRSGRAAYPFVRLDVSVLAELFTHEGVGTMVASEDLEQLRDATADDVGGIIKLIEPLEADGTLVKRPREPCRA